MESPSAKESSSSMAVREPDLVDLPAELFGPISDKLPVIQDLVRFGAVCRWWRRLAMRKKRRLNHDLGDGHPWLMHGHPWLMLSKDDAKITRMRKFYSPTRGELFELKLRAGYSLSAARCWGTPFGWLVAFSSHLFLYLLNPISRASIILSPLRGMLHRQYTSQPMPIRRPPPRRMNDFWINSNVTKLILTAPPHSPNCYVFSISHSTRMLGFLKPGARWTTIDGVTLWTDIVCFQGTLFGCLQDARVLTLDMSSETPKVLDFAPPPPPQDLGEDSDGMNYLVELRGELCMVVRSGGLPDRHLRVEFRVFKIDTTSKQWKRIMSLGGHCLFLGTNYSYAVRASDQLKPDCIYFTSDDHECLFKNTYRIKGVAGIYDVFKGEAAALTTPPSVPAADMTSSYCPPLWFTPRLS